jgi:hypothetical protein
MRWHVSALRNNQDDSVRLHLNDDLVTYRDILAGHGRYHEAIVEVDPADDITSVRSKLESTSVPRVVLVIPPGVKALSDGIEFRVLRRLQRELGLDLIIVSKEFSRRALAHENGFRTTYGSLRAYYKSYPASAKQPDDVSFTDPDEFKPAFSITRWGLIVGMVLAVVVGLAAVLAIPTARVSIYPDTQLLARDVDVLVEIGGPRIDVPTQRLAGRIVEARVRVEDSVRVGEGAGIVETSGQSGFQPGTNITMELRDALRNRMLEQATAQTMAEMNGQVESYESMPLASIQNEIISERYDRNVGDVADTLGGSIEVVSRGLVYSNDDFNRLVTALWSQDVPPDYQPIDRPELSTPAVVSGEGQHLIMRVRAAGTVQQHVDVDAIVAAVRGAGMPEAEELATEAGQLGRPATVEIWPSWAPVAYRVVVETIEELHGDPNGVSQLSRSP